MLHARSIAWAGMDGQPVTVAAPPNPSFVSILTELGFSDRNS
jgi:hypothetical protein